MVTEKTTRDGVNLERDVADLIYKYMHTKSAEALSRRILELVEKDRDVSVEAAISTDAEPDGWICENDFTLDPDLFWKWEDRGLSPKPFYFAPKLPAPSFAVKPLRWKGPDSMGEYHSLDGLWDYIIRAGHKDGFWLTEVGDYFLSPEEAKAAAQADYEARIRSALSAQVQDVAGWQDISTAPKDGTEILGSWKNNLTGHWFVQPIKFRDSSFVVTWDFDEIKPTHWMPLPAAPAAKQEG